MRLLSAAPVAAGSAHVLSDEGWAGALSSFLRKYALTGTLAMLAFGGTLAFLSAPKAPPAPPPVERVRPEWSEIIKPIALYGLATPEFGKEPRLYEAKRHMSGAGRLDALTFGTFDADDKRFLNIAIYRVGAETPGEFSFFVDLARRAAASGLAIARSSQPSALDTRFGAFEVADVTLRGGSEDRACLGFRMNRAEPALRISGFACPSSDAGLDKAAFACTLERLDLHASGDDRPLGDFFAKAELARNPECSPRKKTADANDWLAPGAKSPPLKGTAARKAR